MTWRTLAACDGSSVDFFDHNQTEQALAICAGCDVREPCLADALERPTKEDAGGIFGGKTKTQRDRMRPKRGRIPRQPCGTYAAYIRHKKSKTTPCEPCREANRLHQAAYRARKRAKDAA
jgi:hypothetical protein